MNRKITFIGNGFDLGHNLSSKYSDFECYIDKYYSDELNKLINLKQFNVDKFNLWGDIENALEKMSTLIMAKCIVTMNMVQESFDEQHDYKLSHEFYNLLLSKNFNIEYFLKEFNKIPITTYADLSFDYEMFDKDQRLEILMNNINSFDLLFSSKEMDVIKLALIKNIKILNIRDFDLSYNQQNNFDSTINMLDDFNMLEMFLKTKIIKWADSLNKGIPKNNIHKSNMSKLLYNSDIVNFNYTDTIEKYYSKYVNHIQHIHGQASKLISCEDSSFYDKMQLGGEINWEAFRLHPLEAGYGIDYNNYVNRRKAEFLFDKIDNLEFNTRKSIQDIKFSGKYDCITFFGLSFSGADKNYYKKIVKYIYEKTHIYFYYHSENDIINGTLFLNSLIDYYDGDFDTLRQLHFIEDNSIYS